MREAIFCAFCDFPPCVRISVFRVPRTRIRGRRSADFDLKRECKDVKSSGARRSGWPRALFPEASSPHLAADIGVAINAVRFNLVKRSYVPIRPKT